MKMTDFHTEIDPITNRREVRVRVRALLSEVRYNVELHEPSSAKIPENP